MPLALPAFLVILGASAILFAATSWTFRLGGRLLAALASFALAAYVVVLVLRPPGTLIPNLLVTTVAVLVGSLLGSLAPTLPALASFCLTAAVVDILSFQFGATAKLSQAFQSGSSDLLRYLCLSLPSHPRPQPIIGIGDLVILAAVFSALRRADQHGVLVFAAPVAGLVLALAVGLVVGGIFAIPFIAATTVTYICIVGGRARAA